jgi:hypothetical protein
MFAVVPGLHGRHSLGQAWSGIFACRLWSADFDGHSTAPEGEEALQQPFFLSGSVNGTIQCPSLLLRARDPGPDRIQGLADRSLTHRVHAFACVVMNTSFIVMYDSNNAIHLLSTHDMELWHPANGLFPL